MRKLVSIKIVALVLLWSFVILKTTAQKLPDVQKESITAPANIKIDGKATEWGNKFAAYNKNTDVFYTIANDDVNLYLTIQATDPNISTKIVQGGVSFTINTLLKKDDKNAFIVTYPAYDKGERPLFLIDNRPEQTKDTLKNRMQTDSFMNARNKQLAEHIKSIEIVGAEGDNVISIYNEKGIKAASRFDSKIYYTSELAIPLKLLGIKNDKFTYNIKINGEMPKGSKLVDVGRPDMILFTGPDGKNYSMGKATPENMILAYPTDFWSEYTLAKK